MIEMRDVAYLAVVILLWMISIAAAFLCGVAIMLPEYVGGA